MRTVIVTVVRKITYPLNASPQTQATRLIEMCDSRMQPLTAADLTAFNQLLSDYSAAPDLKIRGRVVDGELYSLKADWPVGANER